MADSVGRNRSQGWGGGGKPVQKHIMAMEIFYSQYIYNFSPCRDAPYCYYPPQNTKIEVLIY